MHSHRLNAHFRTYCFVHFHDRILRDNRDNARAMDSDNIEKIAKQIHADDESPDPELLLCLRSLLAPQGQPLKRNQREVVRLLTARKEATLRLFGAAGTPEYEQRAALMRDRAQRLDRGGLFIYHVRLLDTLSMTCLGKNSRNKQICRELYALGDLIDAVLDKDSVPVLRQYLVRFLLHSYILADVKKVELAASQKMWALVEHFAETIEHAKWRRLGGDEEEEVDLITQPQTAVPKRRRKRKGKKKGGSKRHKSRTAHRKKKHKGKHHTDSAHNIGRLDSVEEVTLEDGKEEAAEIAELEDAAAAQAETPNTAKKGNKKEEEEEGKKKTKKKKAKAKAKHPKAKHPKKDEKAEEGAHAAKKKEGKVEKGDSVEPAAAGEQPAAAGEAEAETQPASAVAEAEAETQPAVADAEATEADAEAGGGPTGDEGPACDDVGEAKAGRDHSDDVPDDGGAEKKQPVDEQKALAIERERENIRYIFNAVLPAIRGFFRRCYVAPDVHMHEHRPQSRISEGGQDRREATVERLTKAIENAYGRLQFMFDLHSSSAAKQLAAAQSPALRKAASTNALYEAFDSGRRDSVVSDADGAARVEPSKRQLEQLVALARTLTMLPHGDVERARAQVFAVESIAHKRNLKSQRAQDEAGGSASSGGGASGAAKPADAVDHSGERTGKNFNALRTELRGEASADELDTLVRSVSNTLPRHKRLGLQLTKDLLRGIREVCAYVPPGHDVIDAMPVVPNAAAPILQHGEGEEAFGGHGGRRPQFSFFSVVRYGIVDQIRHRTMRAGQLNDRVTVTVALLRVLRQLIQLEKREFGERSQKVMQDLLTRLGCCTLVIDIVASAHLGVADNLRVINEALLLGLALFHSDRGCAEGQRRVWQHFACRCDPAAFFGRVGVILNHATAAAGHASDRPHAHAAHAGRRRTSQTARGAADEAAAQTAKVKMRSLRSVAAMHALAFVKELTEGHNLRLQNMLREKSKLFAEIMKLLEFSSTHMDEITAPLVVRCFETLTEALQGPCADNQVALCAETNILELCNRVLLDRLKDIECILPRFCCETCERGGTAGHGHDIGKVLLRSMVKRSVVIFLQALVEGRCTAHEARHAVGDDIPAQVLQAVTVATLKRRLHRLEALCVPGLHSRRRSTRRRSGGGGSLSLRGGGAELSLSLRAGRGRAHKRTASDKRTLLEEGQQIIFLLRQVDLRNEYTSQLRLRPFQIFHEQTQSIEVLWRGEVHRVYFPKHPLCEHFKESSFTWKKLQKELKRTSGPQEKLKDFVERIEDCYQEMRYQEKLSKMPFRVGRFFSNEMMQRSMILGYAFIVILNALMFFWYERPGLVSCPTGAYEAGDSGTIEHAMDSDDAIECAYGEEVESPVLIYTSTFYQVRADREKEIEKELQDRKDGIYKFPITIQDVGMTRGELIVHYFGIIVVTFAVSSLLIYAIAQYPVNVGVRRRKAERWTRVVASRVRWLAFVDSIIRWIIYHAARRSSAEHQIATKALRCTATARMLIAAQCSAIP